MKSAVPDRINLMILVNILDVGGVEEVIRTYAMVLDKTRYRISVFCFTGGVAAREIAAIPGVTLTHITTQSRFKRFLTIWRHARTFKADIIHNHTGWYGLIVGVLVGAKRVETMHNVYHWFGKPQKILYGLYCNLANSIIAVSGVVKDFTIGFFPFFPAHKIHVVHNGIILPKALSPNEKAEIRASLGIPGNAVAIGFIGRLTEQKGLEYLLQAFRTVSVKFPEAFLVIIGDGELRQDLERLIGELGLGARVIMAGFRKDAAHIVGACDIFVLPSLWEGLPIAMLEGMAAGLPVVATTVGGNVEVMVDGCTGYSVEPKNIEQLAEKLGALIADPEKRRQMGVASVKRIVENFSADAMVSNTENIYREIAGKKFDRLPPAK